MRPKSMALRARHGVQDASTARGPGGTPGVDGAEVAVDERMEDRTDINNTKDTTSVEGVGAPSVVITDCNSLSSLARRRDGDVVQ